MAQSDFRELLRVSEVAKMVGVSPTTIYTLMQAKELPYVKVGRGYRIPAKVVSSYLESRCAGFGE